MTKKILAFVLAALMVVSAVSLVACSGTKETNYAAENTEFYIGLSGPLTGGAAIYGVAAKNSAQMAVDEINAAGGLNGVKFKLVVMDDKHDPSMVANNYSTMYEAGMQVSLGCVTTKPALEWKALSAEDNLFFITPSASGDDVATLENGYQMCFADSNQGTEAAKYVNENFAGKKIGVLYKSDDDYSNGIFTKFKAALTAGTDLVETSFNDDTASSFSTQVELLKDCDFIFLPIYYEPASLLMTQAKDTVSVDAVYYGCDGLDGIDSMDGFDIATIPQKVSFLSHFNSKATEGPAADFIGKYTEAYGVDTLNQFGASAYDCVYAIFKAMQKAGDKVSVTMSPSELCKVLKEQFDNGFTFTGVTGDYKNGAQTSMTWTNGYVNKSATVYIVKDKTLPE